MSTSMTLLELRTASKQRADMVNSSFVSDSEWNSYINQSYFELYDILIQKYGDFYFVKNPQPTFTTDGTSQSYPLPSDFYKLLGVDLNLVVSSQNGWVSLSRYNFPERNKFTFPNAQGFYGRWARLEYAIVGPNIMFTPVPSANQQIRLWYIPTLVTLSGDSDTMDGISGWTEYVIIDAAIKAGQKEETDVGVLMAQKKDMLARIESAAENRDAANPCTVSDTRRSGFNGSDGYGDYNGSGWL